ncbi:MULTISPECIES: hypothetical protein [Nocardia]|uniref:hypothetical protein n=1 Tax=Nocardia TaxID=1817 RepID=UPI000313F358|nr:MULTISPECIES: hypothetical protein [Nocardia]
MNEHSDRPQPRAAMTLREIQQLVTANLAFLRRTTRALDLERFAVEHGLDDPPAFENFVRALRVTAGIDYEAVRALNAARKALDPIFAVRAAHGPRLLLWCAGTRSLFTVVAPGGHVIWRDRHPPEAAVDSMVRAAESAAHQAIRVAGQTCGQWGVDAAALRLVVARSHGMDLVGLHGAALAANLLLDIVTDPAGNPAARANTAPCVAWRGSELLALTDPDREQS